MGFRVETDVMVAMRDGVTLATDVWIPDGGGPRPALLVRLPYGKNSFPTNGYFPSTPGLVEAGYCVVWQDCRGMYRSNGEFRPQVDDPTDGADTIAWIREQSWCDGTVGMYGPSYLGWVQWAAATHGVEGLRAIAPTVSSTDAYLEPWYSPAGALSWQTAWMWSVQQGLQLAMKAGRFESLAPARRCSRTRRCTSRTCPSRINPRCTTRPPGSPSTCGIPPGTSSGTVCRISSGSTKWRCRSFRWPGGSIRSSDALRSFVRLRNEGSPALRDEHRLVIGPWDHLNIEGVYYERNFGLSAASYAVDLAGTQLRFFDRHLRGNAAADSGAPVRIFVMGIDQWRDEQDWPLPDTTYVDYFLESGGRANTLEGDGVLSTQTPMSDAADTIVYDPTDPVPTVGGRILSPVGAGPVDQTPVERRRDVLCFTTPVFEDPVEVTGPVTLVLHVTSTAVDTDFTGKLVDVFPDGRALYLTDGILRARYRSSLREPELLEPGQTYELTLDLGANVERVPARPCPAPRGVQQQLPALRPEHEHRRRHRRGPPGGPRRGDEPGPPRPQPPEPPSTADHLLLRRRRSAVEEILALPGTVASGRGPREAARCRVPDD